MFDLTARVFYKSHFDIIPLSQDTRLFDVLINNIIYWLQNKHRYRVKYWNWSKFAQFGEFQTDDKSISAFTTSFVVESQRYWACRIREIQRNDESAPRSWVTEIGFQQTGESSATISYVVYYSDAPGYIGLQEPVPSGNIPSVINRLLCNKSIACKIGSTTLTRRSQCAATRSAPSFAEMLKDPSRGAPIVLLVTKGRDDDGQPIYSMSPDELTNNLAGNALVYYADDVEFCEELSYSVFLKYRCYPGYVRVYQPRMDMNDPSDCGRHRYMTPGEIEKHSPQTVVKMLRRAISQDIGYLDSKRLFRYEDCRALYRESRVRALRAKLDETTEKMLTYEEYKELYECTEEQRETLVQENAQLTDEFDKLRDEHRQLDFAHTSLKTQFKESWALVSDLNGSLTGLREQSELPKNSFEIAKYFERVFAECLAFTDNGIKSLDECVTKPALLWNCLFHMATTLRQLFSSGTANIETEFKIQSGWDMSLSEGSQTRSDPKLMALRRDRFNDREISIEPHVKRGNKDNSPDCIRVYFCYDPDVEKIIIGSCGNHIDNYTSRLIK